MNKLQKKSTKEVQYLISFDSILPTDVEIDSIDSVAISPTGLSYSDELIIDTEVQDVPSGRGILIDFANGSDGIEYRIILTVTGDDDEEYEVIATLVVSDSAITNDTLYYGAVWAANDYMKNRLNTSVWDDSTDVQKRAALCQATLLIDRLNFKGTKVGELQFPRGTDTEVPKAIEQVTYEIAFKLLDEVDIDMEINDLRTVSQGYSSVRVSKDTNWVSEYMQAGIPSALAWSLIKPFLRDPKTMQISRTD